MADLPILLVAAGGSSRLGQPKQLLPWENKTLIEFQIQKLLDTGSPVYVVLGAYAGQIIPVIQKYPVSYFLNKIWGEGMGSSISCGIKELEKINPQADGVLISLVDLPLIPLSHYNKMLSVFHTGGQQIIASKSLSGWLGVPAIFDSYFFGLLKNTHGEKGARNLIRNSKNPVVEIQCNEMEDDIDTIESYQEILKKYKNM